MSLIDLSLAKSYLSVIHDADDDTLQMLLDGAEDEAAQFLGHDDITKAVVGAKLPGSLLLGVMLLLQAAYQASPDDAAKLRLAAEIKLRPFRVSWEN